jgi:hypothetical protein
VRALPRHPKLLRHVCHRAPIDTNPTHQQRTTMHSQTGISVRHEDLLRVKTRHLHCARRSSLVQLPNRRVTNVLAEYI